MSGRKKEIRHGRAASQRFRLVPVFKKDIDRQALARALLLLAEHHAQPGDPAATTTTTTNTDDAREEGIS